ncbi:MAG: aldehyde ferredoxin oxidoreductase family protein [Deltaproteobacteria bacterium]|nr:aldehyde ferredoxin oxidoreductase family protein [Deltaproteobacteria bacterium]
MALYGYGKILDIDLSNAEIKARDIDPDFARKYIGGMGFSLKILYDEVGPSVDPFSPENIVIFANGLLTGTQTPCSGRTEITTKSPLTGTVGTGNTGGLWGARLKRAGFDLIIVRNVSDRPVYIWIDEGIVEIRDASHLWGKDTRQTSDILTGELGSSREAPISVLAIGPAGENRVRYACTLNDYYHVAARTGAGAVMGAKKLKAIAVRGSQDVKIAEPDVFRTARIDAGKRLMAAHRASNTFRKERVPGAPLEPRERDYNEGSLPAKNFQTGVLPGWLETRGYEAALNYEAKKEGACHACPISCFNLVKVKEGKYAGTKANRCTMPGVVFLYGAKCAIDNLPAIWKCKELCQRFGMDYESAGGTIAFALELFQRGILTKQDTDGLELTWGNEDAIIELLRKIAYREGFGDMLAEGSVKAAEIIGKRADRYVMAIKGMEIAMTPDPRSAQYQKSWVIGVITNPRGGDNIKNTHFNADMYNPNWWLDKFDMPEDVKAKIYGMPVEEFCETWEGKTLLCRWYEDLVSILNALGLCIFPSNMYVAWGPVYLSRLVSACTGWDVTPEDIMTSGERIFHVLKAYTIRDGRSRKDDTWPERFFTETLPEGPAKGAVLSRDFIEGIMNEYYDLRGWDRESGLPPREKLMELGLEDLAANLTS